MFSTLTERGAAITLDALCRGRHRLRHQAQQHRQRGSSARAQIAAGTHHQKSMAWPDATRFPPPPSRPCAVRVHRSRRNWRRRHQHSGDWHFHRRAQCLGRIASATSQGFSCAGGDRAAHAACLHSAAGRSSECLLIPCQCAKPKRAATRSPGSAGSRPAIITCVSSGKVRGDPEDESGPAGKLLPSGGGRAVSIRGAELWSERSGGGVDGNGFGRGARSAQIHEAGGECGAGRSLFRGVGHAGAEWLRQAGPMQCSR